MSEPFMGEVKIFSFNYAPVGWAQCNGQFLPINQNQALFSLLGTMYGGNGVTTFALPDLRGRVPMHIGNGHTQGERGGEGSHTVTLAEMPQHTHQVNASTTDGNQPIPAAALLARTVNNIYQTAASFVPLNAGTIGKAGGSQAHTNLEPLLTLNFGIALQGIFPSQN
jgi:microcystin-dependent protein